MKCCAVTAYVAPPNDDFFVCPCVTNNAFARLLGEISAPISVLNLFHLIPEVKIKNFPMFAGRGSEKCCISDLIRLHDYTKHPNCRKIILSKMS